MKILYPLLAYYPSQVGGPANTVYWLTKALVNEKVDVTVITSDLGIKNNNIDRNSFIYTNHGRIYYGKGSRISFKTIYKCLSEVKNHDLIHTNGLFDTLSLITVIFTIIFYPSKKILCSVRGGLRPSALKYSYYKKYLPLFIYKLKKKNIYFHATCLEEIKDIKNQLGDNRICFNLPNFIEPATKIKNVKKKKIIIFLGRIHPIKAIENLIEAVSQSKAFDKKGFTLSIVGDFEKRYEKYFTKLNILAKNLKISDSINFHGHIEGDKKEKLLAKSYALILPSHSENFGNVVLEALNQGTPVIASKGTPWSILQESSCGFHVDNNSSDLSQAIDRLINMNKFEYENYIKNATNLLDKNYDVNSKIYEWINIYKEILNKSS